MCRRQETAPSIEFGLALLLIPLIGALILSACQPPNSTINDTSQNTAISVLQDDPEQSTQLTVIKPADATIQPSPASGCIASGGDLIRQSIYSDHLEADSYFQVYLPPCYHIHIDPLYPTQYLLHGLASTEEQWLQLGLIQKMDALIAAGEVAKFIIVLPWESRLQPPQISPFSDAFVYDLIPEIDTYYCTKAEKDCRGIGGLSRGAAWAVRIGFTHPEFFSSVGATACHFSKQMPGRSVPD